jgi:cyclophilin family peptidyl-prolyl cis-trans isomerase/protein-disulfide isomerase
LNRFWPFPPSVRTFLLLGSLLAVLAASACGANPTATESVQSIGGITPISLGPTITPPPTAAGTSASATLTSLQPVSIADWIRGPDDAAVTIAVYCDYQEAICAAFGEVLNELLRRHPSDLRYIYRHYPLMYDNDKAVLAAHAAESAGQQGKFWEMHDWLNHQYEQWADLSQEDFYDWILESASELDLDVSRFDDDFTDAEFARRMIDAYQDAARAGIPGVPFVFVNGDWFRTSPTLPNLEAAVRLILLERRQFDARPAMTIDEDTLYLARLVTSQGDIVIQLYSRSAPQTVNSFIFLALQDWFDGTTFHLVSPGNVVHGGDPSGTGLGFPGYFTPNEVDPSLTFNQAGMVAMVSSGPGTNGSQFLINLATSSEITGSNTIFGRVIEGLELLQDLESRDPLLDLLDEPEIVVLDVEIEVQ